MPNSILDYSLENIARILGGDVHGSGAGRYAMVPGPGHSAKDRSLRIDLGSQHPDGFLVYSHAGDDHRVCKDYIREKLSLPAFPKANGKHRSAKKLRVTVPPIQNSKPIPESIDGMTPDERLEAAMNARPESSTAKNGKIVEVYDYKDADGITRYQVRRLENKEFPQYRPDGNGGWIPGLGKIKKLPYHLDKIATAPPKSKLYIFEGEKDTDRAIAEFSICATTASGGAKWSKLAEHFKGHEVYIIPDQDTEGQAKGRQAARALHGTAASVRYVTLPGLSGDKADKDLSDWLDADATRASSFIDLCGDAPLWPLESVALEDDSDDGRPSITITAGNISGMATQAEEFLIAVGVPLYQRGESLVRPIIETVDASHDRKTTVAHLKLLDAPYLRDLLSRHINWLRYNESKEKTVKADPPPSVVTTMLSRAGDWKVPAVAGIVSTPTMRPDGSLLVEAGYDAATRLLLVAPPEMPTISKKPTRKDAVAALDLLKGLLSEFPFVDAVALAVALSAIISPVVRGAFPVTPMHVARAPTSGSGKSYLWDIVAAIVIGQLMPVMAAGRTEEETEKRLAAALVAAQPLISIDNVNGELGGDSLCQTIERPIVKIRILGRTEQVHIEARGTSTFASGNNITIVGDVCRRVITATLDPQLERPELRQFSSDPIAAVLENRGAYIAASLTICRSYIVAGRPNPARRLASFEAWSDTVRSALIWLGEADCVDSMEMSREEDPEISDLRNVLTAWAEEIGIGHHHRMTVAGILEMAAQMVATGYSGESPKYPNLQAAIQTVATRGKYTDAKLLGLWLRRRKGRIVGGKCLHVAANPKGGSKWWIEDVSRQREEEDSREEEGAEENSV